MLPGRGVIVEKYGANKPGIIRPRALQVGQISAPGCGSETISDGGTKEGLMAKVTGPSRDIRSKELKLCG